MTKRNLVSFCAAGCGVLCVAGWLALHTFPLQAAPLPQEAAQPNLLHSVAPQYPQAAREKHIEGDVVLEVHIDAAGRVSDTKVLSGPEELRSAALQAILQWHYNPQFMTLPATTQVTMNFKLPTGGPPDSVPTMALPPDWRGTLRSIQIDGLTAAARDELRERLPVHEGDAVNTEMMNSVSKTVHEFDAHLSLSLSPDEPHTLRISLAPAAANSVKIRVGGNVQQAKLLVKVQPIYPVEAKAQRIEGTVVLRTTIGRDGKVENLQVVSGDPLLAAAAVEAVRQWQYQTTLLNGDPVVVLTDVKVNFTLAK